MEASVRERVSEINWEIDCTRPTPVDAQEHQQIGQLN